MMDYTSLKVKVADNLDQQRWDDYVLSNNNTSAYHLFAWKRSIEEAYRHKCIYLYAEKNGGICGILPIVHLHLPCIINEMVSLPFCDVGNCVAENEEIQDLLCNEFLRLIKSAKAKRVQIRGNLIQTNDLKSEFCEKKTGKVRMKLELSCTSEELFKRFKSKLRSQIRKAEKNGVNFIWGYAEDVDRAYKVFSKNMHYLGSPVHSNKFVHAIFSHYGERAKLGLAEFDGKIIGMGLILLGENTVSIPWASTKKEFNHLSTNMLLYWNLLKYSADEGFDFFDFGRSSIGEGTFKFKKQWGALPEPLVWHEKIGAIRTSSESNAAGSDRRDRSAAIWRKLPFWMVNMIGPTIRKYISL